MKNLGFITANYPNEKRVALLPKDVKYIKSYDNIYVEQGYATNLEIADEEYEKAGCIIASKEEIFKNCDYISHLKLIQPNNYKYLRENTTLIGWTHPNGSGKEFIKLAYEKNIIVIDLDNIYPCLYSNKGKIMLLDYIPKNFIRKNSTLAGQASIVSALCAYGKLPNSNTNVAVLSAGNVSQGALDIFHKFNCNIKIFTRSNMNELHDELKLFDIIVSGIEFTETSAPLITKSDMNLIKENCLIIDAAADGGAVIEFMENTTMDNPLKRVNNKFYIWCVNNIPSLFYRQASENISESFSKMYDIDFLKIMEEHCEK